MKKSICLNMIVKNERSVIERCLASVRKLIDYWVIVDTGSTDGTQQIIREFLRGIPGELHERPWVNFGYNRNEALELARKKADYLLFIDADDRLEFEEGFKLSLLEKDCYYALQRTPDRMNNIVVLLIKDLPDYKWKGVLHEALHYRIEKSCEILKGVTNVYNQDGARNADPAKALRDAELLEKGLLEEPENSRYVFYLAQSYMVAGKEALAIHHFERRLSMGGREDEIYYSLYCIAFLRRRKGQSCVEIFRGYSKAYLFRQMRLEPLYDLAEYCLHRGWGLLGKLVAECGKGMRLPEEDLLVEPWKYAGIEALAARFA